MSQPPSEEEHPAAPVPSQKITLADLKLKKSQEDLKQQKKRYELKKYTSYDQVYRDQQIFAYYCQLCGLLSLVLDKPIEQFLQRHSDNSYAVNMRDNKFKHYMDTASSPSFLRRTLGIEQQYVLSCSECKVMLGYQCISEAEARQLVKIKNSQILDEQMITLQNKPFLYLFCDALVKDTKYSRLVKELANIQ